MRRLVCITGALIGHPREHLGWFYRLLLSAQGAAIQDRRLQEQLILRSGLDWTLVRPPRLDNGPARGSWRAGEDLFIGAMAHINRADLASFMLQQLDDPTYIRRGVAIAY